MPGKCKKYIHQNTPILALHQASHLVENPQALLEHPGPGIGERTIIFAVPSAVHPQLQQPRSTPT